MKTLSLLATSLLLVAPTNLAQQRVDPADDPFGALQEWARENLDESVLDALNDIDEERVRKFFIELQRRFEGTSIYDLSDLKDTATRLLPVLRQFKETRPYAVWLETHFDYFDTAEQLKREAKPPPPKPGVPPPKPGTRLQLVPPTPQRQRSAWDKKLEKRPLPPRAQKYVPGLKQIFAAERIPQELVWVAEVESSFDPSARSPVGAVGMFQLMKPTAKSLGLSTILPDERLNPDKNARAAAKYMRHLHRRFGDWRLALAAYNAGEGRIDKLLKQQKVRSFDAIAHRLPAETQMYVPKIEATVRKREGAALADLKMPKG